MSPECIVAYIDGIPRIKLPTLTEYHTKVILEHKHFILINDFNIDEIRDDVSGYGTAESRLKRNNSTYEFKAFPFDPLVIDSYFSVIDGMHRLAYLRRNNIRKFAVYVGCE